MEGYSKEAKNKRDQKEEAEVVYFTLMDIQLENCSK
jgi:hypothetical protein